MTDKLMQATEEWTTATAKLTRAGIRETTVLGRIQLADVKVGDLVALPGDSSGAQWIVVTDVERDGKWISLRHFFHPASRSAKGAPGRKGSYFDLAVAKVQARRTLGSER